jgi:hypothetical protein
VLKNEPNAYMLIMPITLIGRNYSKQCPLQTSFSSSFSGDFFSVCLFCVDFEGFPLDATFTFQIFGCLSLKKLVIKMPLFSYTDFGLVVYGGPINGSTNSIRQNVIF